MIRRADVYLIDIATIGGAIAVGAIVDTPPLAAIVRGYAGDDLSWFVFGVAGCGLRRAARYVAARSESLERANVILFTLALLTAGSAELITLFAGEVRASQLFTDQFTLKIVCALLLVQLAQSVEFHRQIADREQRESDLRRALTDVRLQLLRSQLNPHFLFNALNAVTALINRRPEVAVTMLEQIERLLVRILAPTEKNEVSLREELEILEVYLAIEKVRFGERLNVQFRIDRETAGCLLPQFILQPLLENAVRHGIAPLARGGTLVVESQVREGQFVIRISDDGRGLVTSACSEGTGLSNARERLHCLYGEAGRVSLTSGSPLGAVTELILPVRRVRAA